MDRSAGIPPDLPDLPELPPLDRGEDEAEDPLGDSWDALFPHEEANAEEGEQPSEIDLASFILEVPEIEAFQTVGLDANALNPSDYLPGLLRPIPNDVLTEEGATGPEDAEADDGVSAPTPLEVGEERDDGSEDESWHDLLAESLPDLDADEGGLFEDQTLYELMKREQSLLPWAAKRWSEDPISGGGIECTCLAVGLGVVVAGGQDLLWLAGSAAAPTRQPLLSGTLLSVALVGQTRQAVLCATAAGHLVRTRGDATVPLGSWRAAGAAIGHPTRLCQAADDGPHVVIAQSSRGRVLRTTDGGEHWCPLSLEGRAIALSSRGHPAAVLATTGERIVIHVSEDTGERWRTLAVAGRGRHVALGESPLVSAWAEFVAIASMGRGLAISGDGGSQFGPVMDGAEVSALTIGQWKGQPCAWAAVREEPSRSQSLALVELRGLRATKIAEISAPPSDCEPEAADDPLVLAMEWDADTGCLWMAGSFGLTRFRPVP